MMATCWEAVANQQKPDEQGFVGMRAGDADAFSSGGPPDHFDGHSH